MSNLAFYIVLPILIAIGSALVAVYVMQQRMEVQLGRERQSLSEARAAFEAQKAQLDELNRLRAEAARHEALEDFLADLRTEQRRFIREQKFLFASRKSLVLQERLFFRNIPLCNWVEQEVAVEEGADVEALVRTVAIFVPDLIGPARVRAPKSLPG
jgi:hypothetical protein